ICFTWCFQSDLLSFPTGRSSDLVELELGAQALGGGAFGAEITLGVHALVADEAEDGLGAVARGVQRAVTEGADAELDAEPAAVEGVEPRDELGLELDALAAHPPGDLDADARLERG